MQMTIEESLDVGKNTLHRAVFLQHHSFLVVVPRDDGTETAWQLGFYAVTDAACLLRRRTIAHCLLPAERETASENRRSWLGRRTDSVFSFNPAPVTVVVDSSVTF